MPGYKFGYNALEGYSAYRAKYNEDLSKYVNSDLLLNFQIKKEHDDLIRFGNPYDNLKIKFDVYKQGNIYSVGNVRLSSKNSTKDAPVFPSLARMSGNNL